MILSYIYSAISVFLVSLISLIGILTIRVSKKKQDKILIYLISFSAGSLIGGVFFHMLPEIVLKTGFNNLISFSIILGILFSFILEKSIHMRNCKDCKKHKIHHIGIMSLAGDFMHNFIDGVIIGISYFVSLELGIATTIGVIFHEIPQEISEYGILLHSGFSKKKALFMNFLISLSAFLGLFLAYFIGKVLESFLVYLIPFAAGNFLYIACSNLFPELQKENSFFKTVFQIISFLFGILIMFFLLFLHI